MAIQWEDGYGPSVRPDTPEELARKHMPALNVLLADRVPAERAADLIAAFVANGGEDSLKFATHVVNLRKSFRAASE